MFRVLVVATVLGSLGCGGQAAPRSTLVFLTRDGCVNTDTMRARLDQALRALDRPATYTVIDAGTLPATDPRGGFGTPTMLVDDRDLFGQPTPPVPHPEPT